MKRAISILVILILVTLITGCSNSNNRLPEGYITSQRMFIEKTSFGTYADYVNLAYDSVDFNNTNDRNKVLLIESEGIEPRIYGTAQDGNDFYGWHNLERWTDLYHFTIVNDQTMERKVWVSREKLLNSCVAPDDETGRQITLSNFIASGDSVYATIGYDIDCMPAQVNINGRIVKISKSGDKVEFVGDESVRATEFVVSDGWIYYADNGYVVDGKSYQYNEDKIGVYKIKTNGTEKTLLRSGTRHQSNYAVESGSAGDLALYKDYLYFLDLDNESRLCRIKTDGNDYEQISSSPAHIYTMDTETNTFYYESTAINEGSQEHGKLLCVSLTNKTEKTICSVSRTVNQMTTCDGYLYFYITNTSSSDQPLAYRMNLSDKTTQVLERRFQNNTITWNDCAL